MRTVRLSNDPNANDIPDDLVVKDGGLLQAFQASIPQPFEPGNLHQTVHAPMNYSPVDIANYDLSAVFPSLRQPVGQFGEGPIVWETPDLGEWEASQPTELVRGNTQAWLGVVFLLLVLLLFWR